MKIKMPFTKPKKMPEPPTKKENPVGASSAGYSRHKPIPMDNKAVIKQLSHHYMAFLCVRKIALEVSQVRFECEDADIQAILDAPNPNMAMSELIQKLCISLASVGDAYVVPFRDSVRTVSELWPIRPDMMEAKIGKRNEVTKWEFQGTPKLDLPPEDVLHIVHAWFDDHYGMGAAQPQAGILQAWDAVCQWNGSIMEGAQGISEIFALADIDEDLNSEQMEEITDLLDTFTSGGENVGKKMVLNARLVKISDGQNPQNMQIMEWFNQLTSLVCNGFGVPPILLNIGQGITYENQKEARASFWEDTLIPAYVTPIEQGLTKLLGVKVKANLDDIPALFQRRMDRWCKIDTIKMLTINEKRKLMGQESVGPEGDVLYTNPSELPLGFGTEAAEIKSVEYLARKRGLKVV